MELTLTNHVEAKTVSDWIWWTRSPDIKYIWAVTRRGPIQEFEIPHALVQIISTINEREAISEDSQNSKNLSYNLSYGEQLTAVKSW